LNDFTLKNVYYNATYKRSYATLTHSACSKTFEKRINDFQNGCRCPYCYEKLKQSTLCVAINKYLDENNI